jgi:hypothetical protein
MLNAECLLMAERRLVSDRAASRLSESSTQQSKFSVFTVIGSNPELRMSHPEQTP